MKRTKLHWGVASVCLLAGIALTGLVGHSVGGDEPADVADLTRPKKPKTRVYDSRIQMHRMDWTFEGDEALYRRKNKSQPDLPPGAKDALPPINSELRGETPYLPPPPTTDDTIEDRKRNWILPPAPEDSEGSSESASPWESLMLKPSETPDVTNPYSVAATNRALTSEHPEQQFRAVDEHLLLSDEDIAALAEEAAEKEFTSVEDHEGYQPVLTENSFVGGSGIGFGTSILSRDGDEETSPDEYGASAGEGGVDALGVAGASERSLSDSLGVRRADGGLQLTRRTLGFSSNEEELQSDGTAPTDTTATVRTDGWRGVFRGLGSNLQRPDQATGVPTEEASVYGREIVPSTSVYMPSKTSGTFQDPYSTDSFAPAGPTRSADAEANSSFGGTGFGPTTVDPFSFSKPSYQSEAFSVMGDGQQRLRENTSAGQSRNKDPFSSFRTGFSDPASSSGTGTSNKDQFRVLMR